MTPEVYQERWTALQRGPAEAAAASHLARQVALSFMDLSLFSDQYEAAYIELLCVMATAPRAAVANRAATDALFAIVIEGLCDDFEEPQTGTYNRVMSQVLDYCRRLPAGGKLDRRLTAFGLHTAAAIRRRVEVMRSAGPAPWRGPAPERVVLLSRVTIGADVAIASVLIQRLAAAFPSADLVLLGDARLGTVFGAHPRLRLRPLDYARRGGLLERFATWHEVVRLIAAESAAGRTMVVDPDSRLTQLGILPVAPPADYHFFNSRADAGGGTRRAMSELANAWADAVLGAAPPVLPAVWLPPATCGRAAALAAALRGQGAGQLVAVNLGVGGNPRKRLGDDFEARLLTHLLDTPRTIVVLDQGAGAEEGERSARLLAGLAAAGVAVATARFADPAPAVGRGHGVLALACGIGEIAALLAYCDEFIGYDSACQHLAAALGVPTYTIFAGSNNPRFVRRWRACGPARAEVIHVDTLTHPQAFDAEDIIRRIAFTRGAP